jgi:hypothetical protein
MEPTGKRPLDEDGDGEDNVKHATKAKIPKVEEDSRIGDFKVSCVVPDKKDNKITCRSCCDDLACDHAGIRCGGDHHLCVECSAVFADSTLWEPLLKIPVKCAFCAAPVIAQTFERQLNEEQMNVYLHTLAMNQVGPDEAVRQCPKCPYFEVWKRNEGMTFMSCKSCKRGSCTICKGSIRIPPRGEIHDDDWDLEANDANSYVFHMECAHLAPYLKAFQDALEEGTGTRCPSCGFLGRKDDACTHITCPSCQIEFCYVCGIATANLDKIPTSQLIHGHNADWEYNSKRCPMYLYEINDIDDRWPEDNDNECVGYLSRLKTVANLRTAVEYMGLDIYHKLRAKYKIVRNCGYSEAEIFDTDTTLIIRDEPPTDDSSSEYEEINSNDSYEELSDGAY